MMQFRKRSLIFLSIIIILFGVIFIFPAVVLNNPVVVETIKQKVEQNFGFEIGEIKWSGWSNVTLKDIALSSKTTDLPVEIEQVNLFLNPILLLTNRKNPEKILSKVELLNPKLKLEHYQDGSWNFQKIFTASSDSDKTSQPNIVIKITNGDLELSDSQFGNHRLQRITGFLNMRQYPLIDWNLHGVTDENKSPWISSGKARIDQKNGMGNVKIANLAVKKISNYIPKDYTVQLSDGKISGGISFIWKEGRFTITQGNTTLKNSNVKVALFDKIYVKELQTNFSDSNVTVNKAWINYKDNELKLKGKLNPLESTIDIQLSSKNINLKETASLFPRFSKYGLNGNAALKLNIRGCISEPQIDGEINLSEGIIEINNIGRINNISGKVQVDSNDIVINKLEGNWLGSLIGTKGKINNIFEPQFNLSFYGIDLNADQFSNLSKELRFSFNNKLNCLGTLTGGLDNLLLATKVELDQMTFYDYNLEEVSLRVAWNINNKKVMLQEVKAKVWDGKLTAQGDIQLSDQAITWDIIGGLEKLNLSKVDLYPDVLLTGEASVALISRGSWEKGTNFDAGTLIGTFKGTDINYQEVFLKVTEGTLNYRDGRLCLETVRGEDNQSGKMYGSLVWEDNSLVANVNVEGINLATVLNEKDVPINGLFRGSMAVAGPLSDLTATLKGEFNDITWQGRLIGNVVGELTYANNIIEIESLNVDSTVGDFAVEGSLELKSDPILDITVASNNANIDDFSNWLPVDTGIKLNGIGELKATANGPISDVKYSLIVDINQPSINDVTIEAAHINLEGTMSQLMIQQLELKNSEGELRLAGKITQDYLDLTCKGVLKELQSLGFKFNNRLISGIINFDGTITGSIESPVFNARIDGETLSFGNLKYQNAIAKMNWDLQSCKIEEAILEGAGGKVRVKGDIKNINGWYLNLGVEVISFPIKELLEITDNTYLKADGGLSGDIRINGPISAPEIKAKGNISNGSLNGIEVIGDIDLLYNKSQLIIQKVELHHKQGIMNINGNWQDGRTLKVNANIRNFPIEAIGPLIDNTVALNGETSADIYLEWSEKLITGDYQVDLISLNIDGNELGDLSVKGQFTEQGLKIQYGDLKAKVGAIKADGYFPWPERILNQLNLPIKKSARDLNLNLYFNGITTEYFNFLPKQYKLANGNLDGYLTTQGTLENPVFSGKLTCSDVILSLPQIPLEVNSVEATVEVLSNQIIIKSVSGIIKNGTVNVAGEALITPQGFKSLNISLNGSQVYLKNHYFDGFGDLKIKIQGDMIRPIISGDVKIYDCKINLASTNKSSEIKWSPELNLKMEAGRNVRYRLIGLADIEIYGKLDIKGDFKKLICDGKINSDTGVLTIYGQTFKMNQGMVIFSPLPQSDPYLEVESSLRTSKAEIFLNIKGHIGPNLMFDLSSQPNLSQSEIYALLNWSDLAGEEPLTASGLVGGNLSFVTDTLFGDLFYEIRKFLRVDYFYLETDYLQNEVRINMGDYITDHLYISYSMSINGEQKKDNWEFDYYLNPSFTAGATYSVDDGTTWKLTYRIKF